MRKVTLIPVALATGLGVLSPASAQDASSRSEVGSRGNTLEEVVVTAQRREESVQKTAISITAISGVEILQKGQSTIDSVLRDVPAVQIQGSPQGGQVYIRGVGTNGDNNSIDPAVSLMRDDIYNGRAEAVTAAMYDVARVEVLRGPQGTLYGRNATGGSVNVITNSPVDRFEAVTNLQVGEYDLLHVDSAINLPLGERSAVRVAGMRETRENLLAGTSMMHTMTTPLIVVADDGRTAKGLFYSPGQVTQTPLGQPTANWMWERYAIDFIKEDGAWRIWHFNVFTDFSIAPAADWTQPQSAPKIVLQPGEVPPWQDPNAPQPDIPMDVYQSYGVATVRGETPRIPVPYRTFGETFSYGPPAATKK